MKEYKFLKMAVYTPLSHADIVREALGKAGAGKMGNYEFCSFSVRGVGRFRAMKGAKPFTGEVGEISEVEEEKIETVFASEKLSEVLAAVKNVHPYEEPAIDIYPLIDGL